MPDPSPPVSAPTTPGPRDLATPPPRLRLSARSLLDEDSRPRAPRGPDREYGDHELGAARHLVDVHDHLRAELDEVRRVVDQVVRDAASPAAARSAINVMTVRQQNWSLGAYCQSYCRVVTGHHSLEDAAMLPHLRAAAPGLAPVVDRLEAEHLVVHEVLEELDRALVRWVGDPGAARDVQEAVDLLTDTLLSHLAYEEQQLVEPLAQFGFGVG